MYRALSCLFSPFSSCPLLSHIYFITYLKSSIYTFFEIAKKPEEKNLMTQQEQQEKQNQASDSEEEEEEEGEMESDEESMVLIKKKGFFLPEIKTYYDYRRYLINLPLNCNQPVHVKDITRDFLGYDLSCRLILILRQKGLLVNSSELDDTHFTWDTPNSIIVCDFESLYEFREQVSRPLEGTVFFFNCKRDEDFFPDEDYFPFIPAKRNSNLPIVENVFCTFDITRETVNNFVEQVFFKLSR